MEVIQLTPREVQQRMADGQVICLVSEGGAQSRVLDVENPVGPGEPYKVIFRGFFTNRDLPLDVAPDRRLNVAVYPLAERE